MWNLKNALVLLIAVIGTAQGAYLDAPNELWTASMSGPVLDGNGCFMSPDNTGLFCTDSVGTLQGFDPLTGEDLFTPVVSGAASCDSGVHFNFNSNIPYMVYGATFGSGNDTTGEIYAIDPTGNKLYTFTCEGTVVGTPVTSNSGQYIYANCNDEMGGHFNIYDVSTASASSKNTPTYSLGDSFGPFGPIGYFWNPITGYYLDEGTGNTNDVYVFATNDPLIKGSSIREGILYAFQMPITGTPSALSKMVEKGFQTSTTPLIANSGLNLYISGTRAEFRAWAGVEDLNRYRWNNSATGQIDGERKYNDTRSEEYGASASAPPSLLDNSNMPNLIIPGAAPEIFTADYNYSAASVKMIETADFVYSIIAVSPAGDRAYYADVSGEIQALVIPDLTTAWSANSTGVEGDIALDKGGDVLYVADKEGMVTAWSVTDAVVTRPPTAASDSPSAVPTAMPVTGTMPSTIPMVEVTPAPAPSPPGSTPAPAPAPEVTPEPAPGPADSPTAPPKSDNGGSSAFARSMLTVWVAAVIAIIM